MTDALPSATEWIAAYAARLGIDPPTSDEIEVLLELAAVAAHGSERIAAPLACWLAGRAGITAAAALDACWAVNG
jgi:hypothetical protein